MTNEQLQNFLDRHGGDPARWPPDERAGVERLIAHSAEARDLVAAAQRLDATLHRQAQVEPADAAAVARVLARLGRDLPRQRLSFRRLPAVLLDWQFAPAWPRMAALGACAVLGFAIGLSGLDRRIDNSLDRVTVAANTTTDLGSVVFEPEPLTGAHP